MIRPMSWAPVVSSALEWLWRLAGVATHVRVRAHRARFVGGPRTGLDACFVKVTNTSLSRDVELTHVWFELADGTQLAALEPDRPLPVRLKPQQVWETWVADESFDVAVPSDVAARARVRLADGRTVKGRADPTVPHAGHVAGGAPPAR